jgi:hypothetical protein
MDFGEALKSLRAGKPVRRKQWPADVSLRLANVVTVEPEGKPVLVLGRRWSFQGDDLLADDWTTVEPQGGP